MIVKYSNRKMYCTNQSKYVTLTDLIERVREGNTVTVMDYVTKQDITEKTLAMAVAVTGGLSNIQQLIANK